MPRPGRRGVGRSARHLPRGRTRRRPHRDGRGRRGAVAEAVTHGAGRHGERRTGRHLGRAPHGGCRPQPATPRRRSVPEGARRCRETATGRAPSATVGPAHPGAPPLAPASAATAHRVAERRVAHPALASAPGRSPSPHRPPAARPAPRRAPTAARTADHRQASPRSAPSRSPLTPASPGDLHAAPGSSLPDAAPSGAGGVAAVLAGMLFVFVLAGARLRAPAVALATPPAAPYLGRIVPPD